MTILAETNDPTWTVSGHVVVGAMAPDREASLPVLSLEAAELHIDASGPRTLCMDMTSRSRSYKAQAEITVPAGSRVPLVAQFVDSSRYRGLVRTFTGQDVALRVEDGHCAEIEAGQDGPLIIAGWGAVPIVTPPAEVVLLLNARTSEAAVRLTSAGGVLDQQNCAQVADPQKTGYDFVCRMSLSKVAPDAKIIDGTVARRDFGQIRPPVRFRILLRD